jgi:RNA binding exosome subunit
MFGAASFRVHCHATEIEEKVKAALIFASGIADTKRVHIARNEGVYGNRILVFEASLDKRKDVDAFMARLGETGVLKAVAGELDGRIDDECVLHLRLDKQEAYQEKLVVVQGGDAISVKVKIKTFPAKKELAKKALEGFIASTPAK